MHTAIDEAHIAVAVAQGNADRKAQELLARIETLERIVGQIEVLQLRHVQKINALSDELGIDWD